MRAFLLLMKGRVTRKDATELIKTVFLQNYGESSDQVGLCLLQFSCFRLPWSCVCILNKDPGRPVGVRSLSISRRHSRQEMSSPLNRGLATFVLMLTVILFYTCFTVLFESK